MTFRPCSSTVTVKHLLLSLHILEKSHITYVNMLEYVCATFWQGHEVNTLY